jgi:hypothetical protein
MERRRAAERPVEKKPFPRWLIIAGAIAVPIIGYIGSRGGPENAFQEIAEWMGFVKAPHIVAVQPRVANSRRFLVSVQNPSLRRIQITGYRAEPSIQEAAALSISRAEEDKPERCVRARTIRLRVPVPIAPKGEEGVEVEPWIEECDFSIRVDGTTGESNIAYWMPQTVKRARSIFESDPNAYRELVATADPSFIEYLNQSGLPEPQTVPVRPRASPPPPPPPPAQ